MSSARDVLYLGETNGRPPCRRFGVYVADRLYHLYVIGRTGTGKSTLLESLAAQDLYAGRGFALIDPHGDLVERIAFLAERSGRTDVVYLNVPDPSQPYGYNPLRRVSPEKIPLAASGLIEAMKKLWKDEWGVRMEHILRNALYALLEYGEANLSDVLRVLSDRDYRGDVLRHIKNEQVRAFWTEEFPHYNPRYRQEAIAPIQNKIGAFLADPRLYRLLNTPESDIHVRRLMDDGGVLLVNLSKGKLGSDSSGLLGALLVSTIALAAYSRADVHPDARRPFHLYADEFQTFTTTSFASMVSELRKFGLGLTLANQHLGQLSADVRQAILGNVGTVIAFRLGPEDALPISREFGHVFSPEDLVELPNHNICLRLMIDGAPSRPFSARTLPPG